MKNTVLILLFFIIYTNCTYFFRRPYDRHGNPIFITIPLQEDSLENYILTPSYYTISNNIDNPNSSVFMDKRPTKMQLIKFAINLPSYNFVIHQNRVVKSMIMLNQICDEFDCEFFYHIVIPSTNYSYKRPSNVKGEITQFRATELCFQGYDSTANIDTIDGIAICNFNNHKFNIQPYKSILDEVKSIIEKEKLYE